MKLPFALLDSSSFSQQAYRSPVARAGCPKAAAIAAMLPGSITPCNGQTVSALDRAHSEPASLRVDESFFAEDIRKRAGLLSASITLASAGEIKQLFLTCQAADMPIAQSLRNEPWQAKTFIVKDPDGNLILFDVPAN